MSEAGSGMNRRDFLIRTGGAVAGGLLAGCANGNRAFTPRPGQAVSIYSDPLDPVASAKPSQWAIGHLRQTLTTRGVPARIVTSMSDVDPADLCIRAQRLAGEDTSAEALAIASAQEDGRHFISAQGSDPRGLTYAVTELADVVALSPNPMDGLARVQPIAEKPANEVRSIMRLFSSDIHDKGWYNDRDFWRQYLTMLVSNRYNRFNLALGLGYDFARQLLDTYFYFAYPFLVNPPGYNVRATNLPDSERDSNLEMLRFVSDECALRGLHFQLGIWTHAYIWQASPRVNHVIDGLPADQHANYCRDALTLILKQCPNIAGVTMRIHGESGVNEGSYDFWKVVFSGINNSGRVMPLDLHAKGIDQGMIDTALATGLPVTISPKYWAEHMGLPYHQAAIRPTELPTRQRGSSALMALSTGSRSFTRYGYGDLLTEDRKFGIIHRMWPGTQRVLLWGDPVFAAAYGRASSFCGSNGCEIMEPLSFKGRKGSGNPEGGRLAYADASYRPEGKEFEKYLYTYRVWGRLLYNPDAPAESWRRQLKSDYGPAAADVETALAHAGRILPLFTTAHTPSAANNNYWPEMYVNMPIVTAGPNAEPYGDTPTPRRFGTVSPLDAQLFSTIDDFVDEAVDGKLSGRYTPLEVADWLEELSTTASQARSRAESSQQVRSALFQRMTSDVAVQCALGRFFAQKLRAGVAYALFQQTGDRAMHDDAVMKYTSARQTWEKIIALTKDVYVSDVSYGIGWFQRGHWSDRLESIDRDIEAMKQQSGPATTRPAGAVAQVMKTRRSAIALDHTPRQRFERGKSISIDIGPIRSAGATVELLYRHTHQAEPWQSMAMAGSAAGYSATIAADYTNTPFPIQYYFLVRSTDGALSICPGLGKTLSDQPYLVTRPA